MASLLDIAPAAVKRTTVRVHGVDLDVRGVSLGDISHLIARFPEVKDLFGGKDVDITVDMLVERAPTLINAVIACGTGNRGDAEAESIADGLTIEDQAAVLDAILAETFKGGVGPFVERMRHLMGAASASGTKVLASSTPKPPKH